MTRWNRNSDEREGAWGDRSEEFADRIAERISARMADRMSERIGDRIRERGMDEDRGYSDRMAEFLADRISDRIGDRIGERVADRLRERMGDRLRERVGERIREGVGERVREGMGDRIRERMETRGWEEGDLRERLEDRGWTPGQGRERLAQGGFAGKGPKGFQRNWDHVRERINEALEQDDEVDAEGLEVMVENGEVTLKGTVEDRVQKHAAERVVERVRGVRDVINQIRVARKERAEGETNGGSHPGTRGSRTIGRGADKGALT